MSAKTSVTKSAKVKYSSLKSGSKSSPRIKLPAVKGVRTSISQKYPRLSAKTVKGPKIKTTSASKSVKSLITMLKKTKGMATGLPTSKPPTVPSPAFFGPTDPNTWFSKN